LVVRGDAVTHEAKHEAPLVSMAARIHRVYRHAA
jgi:hypothetical protein